MGRPIKTNSAAFKRSYTATGTIQTAALAAGYSENTAKMGRTGLSQELQRWLDKANARLDKKRALGSAVSADDQEAIVRGHLLENVLSGKDNAVRSSELLGKDKRVAMFTADTQIGIITITPPPALMQAIQARLTQGNNGDTGTDGDK